LHSFSYLQRVADRKSDETGVDRLPAEDGKKCGEKYNKCSNHLQSHSEPPVSDTARVVERLIVVHDSLRFLNEPKKNRMTSFLTILLSQNAFRLLRPKRTYVCVFINQNFFP
jgi:hypothetical protein